MYSISITSRAERELKRLDRQVKNRIVKAVFALADDPRPAGSLKIRSEEGVWRIRVGDWRIGYEIDDAKQEVPSSESVIEASFTIKNLTLINKERR